MLFQTQIPLAERLRPKTIDDFIGQKHLLISIMEFKNTWKEKAMQQ